MCEREIEKKQINTHTNICPLDSCMLCMVTFTINIPQMLAYIPYMDPLGCRPVYTYIIYMHIQGLLRFQPRKPWRAKA